MTRVALLLLLASLAFGQTNPWKRQGTVISPRRSGDSVSMVATLPSEGIVTTAGAALVLATATHNGKTLRFTSADAVTLTLNAGVGVAGFTVTIIQRGAGAVTPTAGAGVAIRQRQSLTKTAGLYAIATLHCDLLDDCILSGDLQ